MRFSFVPQAESKPSRSKKPNKGETDDTDIIYVSGEEAGGPQVEARITRKSLSNKAKMEREKGVVRQLKGNSHPNIMTFFESEAPEDR